MRRLRASGVVLGRDLARDNDAADAVGAEVGFSSRLSLRPFACRAIGAENEEEEGCSDNEDSRDNERDSPCLMWLKAILKEGIIHSWHNEIGDTTTEITESTSQGIGSSNDILVEKSSRPHLAGHKAATKNANEEPERIKTRDIEYGAGEEGGNGSSQETAGKGHARTKVITARPCNKTNDETGLCIS